MRSEEEVRKEYVKILAVVAADGFVDYADEIMTHTLLLTYAWILEVEETSVEHAMDLLNAATRDNNEGLE
jgi:diacylglycerol kinase